MSSPTDKILEEDPLKVAERPRKRRSRADGERTRAAILAEATALATLHGLGGLTIGRLAELTGMSKSGLFAHFGSKEGLQIAVVATAARIAYLEYTRPAMAAVSPAEQLWGLCDYFLSFVERKVFPGGCFFSAVAGEMPALPEPVRDRLQKHIRGWMGLLTQCARDAIEKGELPPEPDAEQLAFELHAVTIDASRLYIIHDDPTAIDRGWASVRRLLGDPNRSRQGAAPPHAE